LIWAHIVLWMILLIKLGDEVLNRFDILIPDIAELAIPKPLAWEYVWVLSIIPSTLGLSALSRNRLHFLNVLYYGIPVFGILPIIGAGIYMFPEIVEYWATRKTKETLMGYPLVWMWYIFFALALQLHLFQVYFSHQLRKAWDKSAKSK
jgi:Jagunal, ER re-organisation during oogenesis